MLKVWNLKKLFPPPTSQILTKLEAKHFPLEDLVFLIDWRSLRFSDLLTFLSLITFTAPKFVLTRMLKVP